MKVGVGVVAENGSLRGMEWEVGDGGQRAHHEGIDDHIEGERDGHQGEHRFGPLVAHLACKPCYEPFRHRPGGLISYLGVPRALRTANAVLSCPCPRMSTLEPPAPAKFDDCASNYDALHAESIAASGESTEYFARYKLACLQRLGLRSQGAVLDYGCGIGNLTEQLVTAFSDVHAFALSKKSLEVAQRRATGATFYESANELPNGRFEAIVVAGVLHHVPPA